MSSSEKIVDYKVICAEFVAEYLIKGWKPYGYPIVRECDIYQAIILCEEEIE